MVEAITRDRRTEAVTHADAPAQVTVVVPVYNAAATLDRCLTAISTSRDVSFETIVVDDGSTDGSVDLARQHGVRLLSSGVVRGGPGHARNVGAQAARSSLLVFVDSDVVIRPNTLEQFVDLFGSESDLAAAFGSYDDQPAAPGILSQYRNLLHHFVHQTGQEDASTFWAGCGAIRREVFLAQGGFSARYDRPSIEDIELGYRLRRAGRRIRLAKQVQVTHLKRWTFTSILRTDIFDRALPWTALIRQTGCLPSDLNLNTASRVSAASVFALSSLGVLGLRQRLAWPLAVIPLGVLLSCNRGLYGFLLSQRGLWFTVRAVPMHWLYYAYSALVFAYGMYVAPRRGQATDDPTCALENNATRLITS